MQKVSSTNSIGSDWVAILNKSDSQSTSPEPLNDFFVDEEPLETLSSATASVLEPIPVQPPHIFATDLHPVDKQRIDSLIADLAQKNLFQLGLESYSLHQRGIEIKTVHPMRFMGHILVDPVLSGHLESIKKKHITYARFQKGFVEHMTEKEKADDLLKHAAGFADHVGVSRRVVEGVIESKKYEDLIKVKTISAKLAKRPF